MNIKVGCDIERISRFDKIVKGGAFFERIYTETEREYILASPRPAQTAAGIYCAKEAVSKALGRGLYGLVPNQIEIRHSESGAPEAVLLASALEQFPETGLSVSISHSGDYAQAVCTAF
jgi:phosphopantetheine--protein transferase-like protein